jgi:hypothetical protein
VLAVYQQLWFGNSTLLFSSVGAACPFQLLHSTVIATPLPRPSHPDKLGKIPIVSGPLAFGLFDATHASSQSGVTKRPDFIKEANFRK